MLIFSQLRQSYGSKPYCSPQEWPLKWILVVCSFRSAYLAQSTDSGSVGSEGVMECQISPNHPLKLISLAAIFTGNSVYIRESICIGLVHSRAILGISVPGWGEGPEPPQMGKCQVYHNMASLKPQFNSLLVLTINEDILGAFGALLVWTENI